MLPCLDYSLPLINGIEATATDLVRRLPKTEVLIFHDARQRNADPGAAEGGARGYLLKSDAKRHLIECH